MYIVYYRIPNETTVPIGICNVRSDQRGSDSEGGIQFFSLNIVIERLNIGLESERLHESDDVYIVRVHMRMKQGCKVTRLRNNHMTTTPGLRIKRARL